MMERIGCWRTQAKRNVDKRAYENEIGKTQTMSDEFY